MADTRQQNMYILDYYKNTIGILSNRMPFSLPFYDDLQERSLDDHTDTLVFKIPANHKEAETIDTEKYILYPTLDKEWKLYKVQEVTEIKEGNEYVKEVYCELSAQDDLIKDVVRPMTFTSAYLDDVLSAILAGTEWVVGDVDDFGALDYEIKDYPTKLQALIDAVKVYGGELEFEYITEGTKVVKQQVSVYKELGEKTGKTFTYGKDIVGIERKEDSSKLVTALIGVGKEINGQPLNFAQETEVQLGCPAGFEKPVGADWVGSLEAVEKYGRNGQHIFGVYRDDNAQSSYELFKNTLEALKKYSKPLMTYRLTVALLERLTGYAHERVRIGDTIIVHDTSVQPELIVQARIRKLSRSITNPLNDAVELGDYIPVVPPVNKRIEKLQAKIRAKEAVWNKAEEIPAIQKELNNKADREELFSAPSQRLKVRYVRDWINGSNINTANHWVEIKVYHKGINIAKGKPVTTNAPAITNAQYVTDDMVDSDLYARTDGGSPQYVQIDLEQVYEDVEYIHVWHYYYDGRTYNQHFVDVSEDGILWIRLYNSERNGSHKESADGLIVPVNSSAILTTQKKKQEQIVKDIKNLEEFKQSTKVVLDQKVDLLQYNNKVQELEKNIASKVGLDYVNGQLKTKANITDVYTKPEVDNALAGKVSTTQYNADKNANEKRFTSLETSVQQNANAIALKADKAYVDAIENRVDDTEAQLTVQANEIASKVSKTQYDADMAKVISRLDNADTSITQNAEAIALKADKYAVDALASRVSNAEAQLTVQANQIATKVTADEVKGIGRRTEVVKVRYIRVIGKGNSVNSGSHLVELMAFQGQTNVAQGKKVTASWGNATNLQYVNDGVINSGHFSLFNNSLTTPQWVQIDLGAVYDDIDYIKVWFYYWDEANNRQYIYELQVSDDGVNWLSLYDSERDGRYVSRSAGFVIPVNSNRVINTMQSQITQNADSIQLKVDKNGVISAINQSPEQITIEARRINLVGAVNADAIQAGAVTADKLDVRAKNLMNNPTATGVLTGWATENVSGESSSLSITTSSSRNAPVMLLTSDGRIDAVHDYMEISPTNTYKLTASLFCSESVGTRAVYVYAYDSNKTLLNVTQFNPADKYNLGTNTTGVLFEKTGVVQGTATGNYLPIEVYILGSEAEPNQAPTGKEVKNIVKMPPNARYLRIAFSNQGNTAGSPTHLLVFSPTLTPVDAGIFSFDSARGGTLTLGGHDNQNGKLQVLDANGDVIADLDASSGGFSSLYVANLDAPNVSKYGDYRSSELVLYVSSYKVHSDGLEPDDSNSGTDWYNPLRTIEEALRRIPKVFDGQVTIKLAYGGTYHETVAVSGFSGGGTLVIDGQGMTATKVVGRILVQKNNVTVHIKNLTLQSTTNHSALTYWWTNGYADSVRVYGISGGGTTYGIDVLHGSFVQVENCEVYDTQNAICARYGGTVMNINNKGYGQVRGLFAYSGYIVGYGTAPAGASFTATMYGGQIFYSSFTANNGSYTPPATPETTQTWNSTGSRSWRDDFGGQWYDSSNVLQGYWGGHGIYRGLWFFGSAPSNTVKGKKIKHMRLYVRRYDNTGNSGAVTIYFRPHGYTSQPSEKPTFLGNVYTTATFKWGEAKWITLPSSFYSYFESGQAKGIGIYINSTSSSYYARFYGSAKLEITYA